MSKLKSILLAATAMAMMSDIPMLTGVHRPRKYRKTQHFDGHISWGHFHDAKTKRSRAKEKRAKQARKINWN
jgi:hypothetical protein